MNAQLPATLAPAVLGLVPADSIVREIFTPEQAARIDMAMLADKQSDGYGRRHIESALRLQGITNRHNARNF